MSESELLAVGAFAMIVALSFLGAKLCFTVKDLACRAIRGQLGRLLLVGLAMNWILFFVFYYTALWIPEKAILALFTWQVVSQ